MWEMSEGEREGGEGGEGKEGGEGRERRAAKQVQNSAEQVASAPPIIGLVGIATINATNQGDAPKT